ncbi:MAG TPA: hypothetical protein DEB06_09385 [Phycisphaerales bacterium]|nr:hypothetical protein [Phycisphaerales bacterium]
MNTLTKVVLLAALASVPAACEKKASAPAGASSTNAAPTTPVAQASGHPTGGDEHPKASNEHPANIEPKAPEWTQQTSEGTIHLFVLAMSEAQFQDAAVLVDPASEAYDDFVKMKEMFDPATANPNVPAAMLDLIKARFAGPWKGAKIARVAEASPRAQYSVTMANGIEKLIDLNLFQDNWYILGTKNLLAPGKPADAPEAPKAPEGAPAGTGQPSPGPGR